MCQRRTAPIGARRRHRRFTSPPIAMSPSSLAQRGIGLAHMPSSRHAARRRRSPTISRRNAATLRCMLPVATRLSLENNLQNVPKIARLALNTINTQVLIRPRRYIYRRISFSFDFLLSYFPHAAAPQAAAFDLQDDKSARALS